MTKDFIQSVVNPALITLRLQATRKDEAIRELLGMLTAAGLLKNPQEAERAVFDRERAMSTGMEHGIAIPHGKTNTVERLQVAVGISPEGLDFQALDGKPSTIFFLVISPLSSPGPHLRFMAEISKILRNGIVRDNLLAARTPEEAVQALVNAAI